MRYEKKYRITECSAQEVLQVLWHHPMSFRKAYPDRRINSLYFDSPDLQSLQENQAGISQRRKYRIRWYGEELYQVKKPKLEIKIRNNQFGRKELIDLPDFDLRDPRVLEGLSREHVPEDLRPSVLTRYKRAYFQSQSARLRATVDTEVCYYGFKEFHLLPMPHRDEAIILEMKCAKEDAKLLKEANQQVPFRITKNSKYVNGVMAVNGLVVN